MGNAQIDVCPDKKIFRQMGCRETGHTQYPTQMYRQCQSLEMDLQTQEDAPVWERQTAGHYSSKVTAILAPEHMLCTCKCPPVQGSTALGLLQGKNAPHML